MNNAQVSTVLKCENILGESCFWDPRYDCLVWTDIQGKKAFKLDDKNKSFEFNLFSLSNNSDHNFLTNL